MARKRLTRFGGEIPLWRQRLRDKMKLLTREGVKETRDRVARKISEESENRVYRKLKIRGKERRDKAHEKILDQKRRIIQRLHPDWDEPEVDALAAKSTLLKGEEIRRADYRGKRFIRVKGRLWRRAVRVKVRGETRYKVTGKFLSESTVNRSLAAKVYWARVRSLSDALGIPVSEARKADKMLLEVPESVRRRIYERLVDRALKELPLRAKKAAGRIHGRKRR